MLHYHINDWMKIQQRMVREGLDDVPNGKMVDSYLTANGLVYMVDFKSEKDEMWFRLKWE